MIESSSLRDSIEKTGNKLTVFHLLLAFVLVLLTANIIVAELVGYSFLLKNLVLEGLVLDVIAAIIIAVPDFPSYGKEVPGERLDDALRRLENSHITSSHPGFKDVFSVVSEYTQVDESDVCGISCYTYQDGVFIYTDPSTMEFHPGNGLTDESNGKIIQDEDITTEIISALQEKRNRQGRYYTVGGLAILSLGFALQALGNALA